MTSHTRTPSLVNPAAHAVAHGTVARNPSNINMPGLTNNTVNGDQNTNHTYPPARNEEPHAVAAELFEMRRNGRWLLLILAALVFGMVAAVVVLLVFVLRA